MRLDTWLPNQVELVSQIGNKRANAYYEKNLPSSFVRPNIEDSVKLESFIRAKYVQKRYADTTRDVSMTL